MDRKILYLLERCATTIEEVTFVHIPGHSYDLSNLEVDKMARQELEKEYLKTIPKKSTPIEQGKEEPAIQGNANEEEKKSDGQGTCRCKCQPNPPFNEFRRFMKENLK